MVINEFSRRRGELVQPGMKMEVFKQIAEKINGIHLYACLLVVITAPYGVKADQFTEQHALKQVEKGFVYLDEDKGDLALTAFNAALEVIPNHEKALSGKAEVFSLSQDWKSAAAVYAKLNKIKPGTYHILSRYLAALEKASIQGPQLEVLRALFELNKSDHVLGIKYLKMLESSGVSKNNKHYMELLEILSNHPNADVLFAKKLGLAQKADILTTDNQRASRDKKLMKFRKKILSINRLEVAKIDTSGVQQKIMTELFRHPDDQQLLLAQGILYFYQGRYGTAQMYLKKLKGWNAVSRQVQGQIHFHLERFALAADCFGKIPRAAMTQEIWELYCDALVSSNQKEKAMKENKQL
ncbi:tetratricopeptide repeat protein, partial [Fibrobacterota bacterium]